MYLKKTTVSLWRERLATSTWFSLDTSLFYTTFVTNVNQVSLFLTYIISYNISISGVNIGIYERFISVLIYFTPTVGSLLYIEKI